MQEVEGLTVAAIDWIAGSISAVPRLIRKKFRLDGDVCALGAAGFYGFMDSLTLQKAIEVELAVRNDDPRRTWARPSWDGYAYTEATSAIADCNNEFLGTCEERKTHVLSWLRAQRDMKCSDWMAPIKEVVPKRKVVLA